MRHRLFAAGLSSLLAVAPLAASTLYMSDDGSDAIFTVDINTGAATLVGPTILDLSFSGLAWDSRNGALYVSDVVDPACRDRVPVQEGRNVGPTAPAGCAGLGLGRVDPTTGAVTFIGGHVTTNNIHGLAYDVHNDVLYGADINNGGGLSIIDRATGYSTFVGVWGTTVEIRGLAYDAKTDTLYGVDYNPGSLYTIDRATGAATLVGSLGFTSGFFEGLDLDPDNGLLYMVEDVNQVLYSLDRSTGAASAIGPLGSGGLPSGLAFVGEPLPNWISVPTLSPAALALLALALGATALLVLRRRRAA